MRAPSDLATLDFTLQKLAFTTEISAKVQSGSVRLAILPCWPQPIVDAELMSAAGVPVGDELALIGVVERAFRQGLIDRSMAPIRVGHAFELLQALPGQKFNRLGTGLVKDVGITRLSQITELQRQGAGHPTLHDLSRYWASNMPDFPAHTNPWCWLIFFENKG